MKNKQRFSIVATFLFLTLVFPLTIVKAYTFTPSSGSYAPGSSFDIKLYAAPPSGTDVAVNISLLASNLTITNYVPNSAAFPLVVNCGGAGSSFTSTTVCVSESKSGGGTIANGELLGTITVTVNSDPATLTKQSDNAYSDGSTSTPDTSGSASFTVTGSGSSSSSSTLPNTAFGDTVDTRVDILLLFIVLVVLGLVVSKLFQLSKETHELQN